MTSDGNNFFKKVWKVFHCAFNFGSSRAQAREQPHWLIFVPDFSPSRQNLEKFYSYLFYNSLSDFGSDVWKRPCGARFERHNTLFDNQNKFCELCRPRPRQLGLMTLWWLSEKVFHFTFIRRENKITLFLILKFFSRPYNSGYNFEFNKKKVVN